VDTAGDAQLKKRRISHAFGTGPASPKSPVATPETLQERSDSQTCSDVAAGNTKAGQISPRAAVLLQLSAQMHMIGEQLQNMESLLKSLNAV
jgi:hypothetical protein